MKGTIVLVHYPAFKTASTNIGKIEENKESEHSRD